MQKKPALTLIMLWILLGFQTLSALFGGATLILAPDGSLIDMPLSLLDRAPFSDFTVPGLFLFFVLGIGPLLLLVAQWKRCSVAVFETLNIDRRQHWSLTFATYLGLALIAWIILQVTWVGYASFLQPLYGLVGVAMVFFSLLPGPRSYFAS